MASYYDAYDDGHAEGAREGFKSGAAEGYTKGHAEGAQSGYAKGYEEGYAAGGGGASSEWKYQDKSVLGYAGDTASDFGKQPSVLYAPNAEGALSEGQLAGTDFSASSVILDFPKVTSIGEHCFSGMTVDGAQGVTVGSGNFPEVTLVEDDAFVGLEAVTAGFPECTSVGLEAFHMHDYFDQQGQPEYQASGSLSFPAMTPMWACFPAMSGTYGEESTPYHIGPRKVPVIPVFMDGWHYPQTATRILDVGSLHPDWHWGSPGSGAETSTDVSWSGTSCGCGFKLSYENGTGAGDAGSGYQAGPFGRVLYRNGGGSEDGWQVIYKQSKFDVSLPNIPAAAVENTRSLQSVEAAAYLPPCGGYPTGSVAADMNVLGLAGGSTIACSDGVYTV